MEQEGRQIVDEAGAPKRAFIVPSRPEWAKRLNLREYKFILEFMVDLDVRATAARVWPKEHHEVAQNRAKRWLKRFRVAEAIDYAMSTDGGSARTQVLREMHAMAFVNPKSFFKRDADGHTVSRDILEIDDEDAKCVAEVVGSTSVIDRADGTTITTRDQRLKFCNKLDALGQFAKILNMHKPVPEPTAASVTVNITVTRFAHLLDDPQPIAVDVTPTRIEREDDDAGD